MPDRPRIPADIERQILVESGHRCAVCGTPIPLERAHIIPWHQTKEHKLDDLVCLCANCHGRADKERWGEKTLRMYKERPWIFRAEQQERVKDPLLTRVQEAAGQLAEALSGGNLRGLSEEEALGLLRELLELRGRLRKHSGLMQALRDFENTAGWLLRGKGGFDTLEERNETLQELEQRFREVIWQADAVQ